MDVVGLDVVLDIENHYADSRKGLPTEPREYLCKMIENGKLGIKNGRASMITDRRVHVLRVGKK